MIVILKRFFKDEGNLPYNISRKMAAVLNSIERINHEIYDRTVRDTITGLLVAADDNLIIRVFMVLNYAPGIWALIENSERKRIVQLISQIGVKEIIDYQLHLCATNLTEIKKALLERVQALSENNQRQLLSKVHSQIYKTPAIELFTSTSGFDDARSDGKKVLLPYAVYFEHSDLQLLLTGCLKNRSYGVRRQNLSDT